MALNLTPSQVTPTGTLTGTPASPTSIAAAGSATATFTLRTLGSASGVVSAEATVRLIVGSSAPTTSPSVQWQYTLDGTNYFNDGGAWTPSVSASTSYDSPLYPAPPEAVAVQAVVTNGATNGITAFAQCNKNTSS